MYWSLVDYKNTGTISVGEIIVKNDLFFDGSGKLVTYLAVFSVLSWFCVTKIGSKRVENTPKIIKAQGELFDFKNLIFFNKVEIRNRKYISS